MAATSAIITGCSVGYDASGEGSDDVGAVTLPLAACVGDDDTYDYNAFSASLAIAIANELKRWDVAADFAVRNGKLELSTTGAMKCWTGCANINAMLRLQDDAASAVPNHSPAIYRSKLTAWHKTQVEKLTALSNSMLTVDKGIYRLQVRHSRKYMAVDAGSLNDNAVVEQRGTAPAAGADQWRLLLKGTKHQFVNVRSGKCLSLALDSGTNSVGMVQKTCVGSASQSFEFGDVGSGNYAIRTTYGKAVDVSGASTADDARLIQYTSNSSSSNQHWAFQPVGTGAHVHPTAVATAVYTLTFRHSGKAAAVDEGALWSGQALEQRTYDGMDDRFHWYVFRNGSTYQLANRRSGRCMALQWDKPDAYLAQHVCDSTASAQQFTMAPTGDGHQMLYTKYGRAVEVKGASTLDAAVIGQGDPSLANQRQIKLTPLLAGEPHTLTFAYTTADASCGEYNYWYNITKPNGQPLDFPHDTWVHLIFAGGKQSASGSDVNPFIAQQIKGNLVAIDPTAGLNEGPSTMSGSCAAACSKFSTTNISGQCCVCNGASKKFVRSTFSASMYLCTGK